MSLAGNLRQFPLTDVLREIEATQRTGCLTLARGKLRAEIYFSGGQWLLANRSGVHMVLAQQFVRAGLLNAEDFEATVGIPIADAGEVSDVQVVRLLISGGLLTQEQLRKWAINDAVALLTVVLAWPEGEFSFADRVPIPAGRVALPLPLAQLMAQVARSAPPPVEAQPVPREARPPTPDLVLDFAPTEPRGPQAIQLTREQWRMLTHVNGAIPLWAICRDLGAPEPAILRVAGELLQGGILTVVGRHPPGMGD